ncbi:MAG: hypothetical protein P8129_13980 [Anaerolineae bacterium]|jgi:hypothetical protein
MLRKAIRALDALLRRIYGVREFSDDEQCILRISQVTAERTLTLSDGTVVHRGDLLGELHFWNEHLQVMPASGPDAGWARAFWRQVSHSFRLLAAYVEETPEFDEAQAFTGRISFGARYEPTHLAQMLGRTGFDVISLETPSGLWQRFFRFWEEVYGLGLAWAYNPGSFHAGGMPSLRRDELWMSRRTLFEIYGSDEAGPRPALKHRRRPTSGHEPQAAPEEREVTPAVERTTRG